MIYDPWPCEDAGHCLADQIRARLAEVEAERDELTAGYAAQIETISDLLRRVRAVEAVCNEASGDHIGGVTVVRVPLVRAAARGEDDRGNR